MTSKMSRSVMAVWLIDRGVFIRIVIRRFFDRGFVRYVDARGYNRQFRPVGYG
jgi:hypothetical protein